jgi:hypothetical protein
MVYERIEMLRLKRLDVLRAKLQEAAIVVLQRWLGVRGCWDGDEVFSMDWVDFRNTTKIEYQLNQGK